MHEQDLIQTCQALLDKCKVNEQAVLSYQKAKGDQLSSMELATATVDAFKSRTLYNSHHTMMIDEPAKTKSTVSLRTKTPTKTTPMTG